MDRRPSENTLPLQMQFVVAASGPNMPVAVQLRTHEQSPHPELRESLYSAINEIKSLKDQNKALMTENSELKKELTSKDKALERAKTTASMLSFTSQEWRMRCEVAEKGLAANTFQLQELKNKLQEQEQDLTRRQVEVSRFQEELQEKTFLHEMEIQKHQATTKAHAETLQQLSRKETQLRQWKSRCDALEESHVSNSTQLQELNAKLQEQKQVLTSRQVEVRRLEEKLDHNENVLMTAVLKRTKDRVDTQDQSAQTEQELKRSWCDAPEENHAEVSRLQEELLEKNGLLDRETKKRLLRTEAHIETLYQLSLKETELNRIEAQWKSWYEALEESHVSNSYQLQEELNIILEEQDQVLTSSQVEVSHLQEELQKTHGLLNRETKKRRLRTEAHIDTLFQLSLKETELNRIEAQWKSWYEALEESHVSNSYQLQEVTKRSAQEEEKKNEEEKIEKKREEESTKMDNDMEEIKEEGNSGERERKQTKGHHKRKAKRRNH